MEYIKTLSTACCALFLLVGASAHGMEKSNYKSIDRKTTSNKIEETKPFKLLSKEEIESYALIKKIQENKRPTVSKITDKMVKEKNRNKRIKQYTQAISSLYSDEATPLVAIEGKIYKKKDLKILELEVSKLLKEYSRS